MLDLRVGQVKGRRAASMDDTETIGDEIKAKRSTIHRDRRSPWQRRRPMKNKPRETQRAITWRAKKRAPLVSARRRVGRQHNTADDLNMADRVCTVCTVCVTHTHTHMHTHTG